jgi:hypothetical protein
VVCHEDAAVQGLEQLGQRVTQVRRILEPVIGEPVEIRGLAHRDARGRADLHLAGVAKDDLTGDDGHPTRRQHMVPSGIQTGCLQIHGEEFDAAERCPGWRGRRCGQLADQTFGPALAER